MEEEFKEDIERKVLQIKQKFSEGGFDRQPAQVRRIAALVWLGALDKVLYGFSELEVSDIYAIVLSEVRKHAPEEVLNCRLQHTRMTEAVLSEVEEYGKQQQQTLIYFQPFSWVNPCSWWKGRSGVAKEAGLVYLSGPKINGIPVYFKFKWVSKGDKIPFECRC